ncbi:olfactory receptor 52D1-like [Sphaeramia orbicularis]|uniref:olfactory receptor 52D1-like n=1 Tax=Sphaeramia orbicularis TaxID=375764 RepID=UPI00117F56C7|nr:olfactory receptor 52D1-like [Sphaeramia orbicularis]
MDNRTALTFKMTAYAAFENHKYEFFVLFLLLYVITVFLNSLLITVIHQIKELHQPMNVFTCLLSLNELYGSTALFPATLSLLLSDTNEAAIKWCMAQVYFLHTYAGAEFCILAIMGYDRYIAICHPLHYHSIMSNSRVSKLVALTTLYPLIIFGCYYSLTLQLTFCGKFIPKMYCVNMELVKNACSTNFYISIVGLALIFLMVVPQLLMIVFSYAQISRVCRTLSKESQGNALRTCIPHLLSLVNYTIGSLFEIIQTRFNMSYVALEARIFLSLYFVIIPPITNPVLYGLGTQIVRVHILKLLIRYKIHPAKIKKVVTDESLPSTSSVPCNSNATQTSAVVLYMTPASARPWQPPLVPYSTRARLVSTCTHHGLKSPHLAGDPANYGLSPSAVNLTLVSFSLANSLACYEINQWQRHTSPFQKKMQFSDRKPNY